MNIYWTLHVSRTSQMTTNPLLITLHRGNQFNRSAFINDSYYSISHWHVRDDWRQFWNALHVHLYVIETQLETRNFPRWFSSLRTDNNTLISFSFRTTIYFYYNVNNRKCYLSDTKSKDGSHFYVSYNHGNVINIK